MVEMGHGGIPKFNAWQLTECNQLPQVAQNPKTQQPVTLMGRINITPVFLNEPPPKSATCPFSSVSGLGYMCGGWAGSSHPGSVMLWVSANCRPARTLHIWVKAVRKRLFYVPCRPLSFWDAIQEDGDGRVCKTLLLYSRELPSSVPDIWLLGQVKYFWLLGPLREFSTELGSLLWEGRGQRGLVQLCSATTGHTGTTSISLPGALKSFSIEFFGDWPHSFA